MFNMFATPELVNTQHIKLGKAQRVSISYITERVTVHMTDGETLVLQEYLTERDPELFARITADPDGVTIRNGDRSRMFSALRGYIEVYLPRSYFGVLNIKTISGRIVIDEKLVLSELALSTTSGRIILGDVTCGTAVLSTVSSGVEVESLKSLATIHSTTGSIRIGSAAGGGEFKTVSGSIDLPYAAVTGDITASSVSGSLRLYLPTTLSFAVDAQNITGSISIPFEGSFTGGKHAVSGTVGNGPQANIHLRSVSGRIDVLPLLK